ncbi:MAG: hypothetical protein NTV86_04480 [Planctomycetota bacterium]|nr:hypothetical protein [Planctomycetota bacterium]
MALLRTTGIALGLTVVSMLAIVSQIDNVFQDIRRDPGTLWLLAGLFAGGFAFFWLFAFVIVLARGGLRAKEKLSQLVFYTNEGGGFGVFVNAGQLALALPVLRWAKIDVRTVART